MLIGSVNSSSAFTGLADSMRLMSSGVKSSSDDAAGVGISERMRSQADGTVMARQNVENGISALQTTDGWMQEVHDTMGRMNELAVRAGDITLSSSDRDNLDIEYQELKSQVIDTVENANFNGVGLLNGELSGETQVGPESGETITVPSVDLSNLMDGVGSISDPSAISAELESLSDASDALSEQRATVGSMASRFASTRDGLLGSEENIRASESKIRDVDYGLQSMQSTQQSMLGQVDIAMRAQANQLNSSVLNLIG